MHRRVQAVLLIFIGVIATCLVVGAVVKARSLSNELTCSNRLKSIVQACHDYHTDHTCLPPGYVGPWPDRAGIDRAPHVGVLVYVLPYLTKEEKSWEVPYYQTDLSALTDPADKAKTYQPASDAPWWTLTNPANIRTNLALARKQFPFLLCPSVKELQPEEGIIVAMHAFGKTDFKEGFLQRHVVTVSDDPSISQWGVTHYLGIMGRFGLGDQFEGIFTNRSRLTMEKISVNDGCSTTFAFGEATGGLAPGVGTTITKRLTAYSWFCGSLPTYYGLHDPPDAPWYAFNGPHAAYVKFAFMDGSVRHFQRSGVESATGTDDGTPVPWVMTGKASDPTSRRWMWLQSLAGYKDGLHYGPVMLVD